LLQCRVQQQHPKLRPSAKKFCKGCGVLQEPQVPKSANCNQEHRLVGLRRIASRRGNRKAPSALQMSAFGVKRTSHGHAVTRSATRVLIKNMAMCRAWLALLLFVHLHSMFQDVGLPTR